MENKTNICKERHAELFRAVKHAIDDWNPYSLLPEAPADEFDGESCMILAQLKYDNNVDEIADIVSGVFIKMFDEPEHFNKEKCLDVAKAIKINIENVRPKEALL